MLAAVALDGVAAGRAIDERAVVGAGIGTDSGSAGAATTTDAAGMIGDRGARLGIAAVGVDATRG